MFSLYSSKHQDRQNWWRKTSSLWATFRGTSGSSSSRGNFYFFHCEGNKNIKEVRKRCAKTPLCLNALILTPFFSLRILKLQLLFICVSVCVCVCLCFIQFLCWAVFFSHFRFVLIQISSRKKELSHVSSTIWLPQKRTSLLLFNFLPGYLKISLPHFYCAAWMPACLLSNSGVEFFYAFGF